MRSTNRRFKRKPKDKRESYPVYLQGRIDQLKADLAKEERPYIKEKIQNKLEYAEKRFKELGNTSKFLHTLEDLIKEAGL